MQKCIGLTNSASARNGLCPCPQKIKQPTYIDKKTIRVFYMHEQNLHGVYEDSAFAHKI